MRADGAVCGVGTEHVGERHLVGGGGALATQRAERGEEGIGHVTDSLGGGAHALLHFGGDARIIAQDTRHGGLVHAGRTGDILHGGGRRDIFHASASTMIALAQRKPVVQCRNHAF